MTPHQIAQKEARDRKYQKMMARQAQHKAATRRLQRIEVPKDDLLKVLIDEGFIPADATRIIGTGHNPEILSITVTFDA